MKTKERAVNRGPHPVANWVFPLLGILITAVLMSCSSYFHVLTFFVLTGPFFLLGLACQICRKSATARALGFTLTVIQFVGTFFSYLLIYVMAVQSACGALGIVPFVFVFTWLFAIVSFFVLLSKAASDETPEKPPSSPLGKPEAWSKEQNAEKLPNH